MSNFGSGVEKRQFGRRQTHLHAWVSVPGRPRIPCLVKDISIGGALLAFDKVPSCLPFCFRLTIESTRFESACEIRHTRSNAVGVEFVPMELLAAIEKRSQGGEVEDWIGMRTAEAPASPVRTPGNTRR